jgi:undecaprenyl diphosphate synthase
MAGNSKVAATAPRNSDLGVRVLSAVVMVALAGLALWLGAWPFAAFVALLEDALAQTAHGGRTLAVALNYGSQHEIARAATKAAAEGDITAQSIERHLDTAPLPPLDLLIRTSGEVRLSNFLLWQAAYAEMIFTDVLWPDFTPAHLNEALDEFARRERRYGGR